MATERAEHREEEHAALKDRQRAVGITTTIPVEAVFAAGLIPVDLNNLFVFHHRREEMIDYALARGFPQNSCAWTKGVFAAAASGDGPSRVIGVVRGDCSGTEVLLEALELQGVEVIGFSYPYPPGAADLRREIGRLLDSLNATWEEAERWRERLEGPRRGLREVDRLCFEDNRVTGAENHRWLVSSSDFGGDPDRFSDELKEFLESARARRPLELKGGIPFQREVRLGYIGVPPIDPVIFPMAESMGARFVFHEVQRQFSMPHNCGDIVEQYLAYTYPYTIAGRSVDINRESDIRRLDGLVHYVQSFCHRNLEDVVFSRMLARPVLTVECDCPGGIGAQAAARLENFIQVLGENL
ncbi:MAG: 2-hydroxyacyl-CoA dehydratase [Actinobacteria bacterium]|nr:2-hydroxyacyl-CoA dehydratase [Actinomycetota bacterium]MCG2818943.1 2-hydroxyacyl-CoA dehydratase [Actinomycetes bacterium]MBU4178985.1 2-hydroxyacyl-CoA dehydratase [Actinomycetota bacterium]MBU4219503.1 2-hydroxyacyl-CoA dehydratase [Actinomycetota bacterium]MBU4359137.1 2-hydroxyacyl-CoA dehydratase [Actinomycetota bacterium]